MIPVIGDARSIIRWHTQRGENDEARVTTVEGGGAVRGVEVDPGDDTAMMAYGGAMGPSAGAGGGGDVLGTAAGDYSPQSTPTPLTGHSGATGATVEGAYTPGATGAASYSPQDSPASSAGGSGNGQLPSFGFTQEQVACVCEVSKSLRRLQLLFTAGDCPFRKRHYLKTGRLLAKTKKKKNNRKLRINQRISEKYRKKKTIALSCFPLRFCL